MSGNCPQFSLSRLEGVSLDNILFFSEACVPSLAFFLLLLLLVAIYILGTASHIYFLVLELLRHYRWTKRVRNTTLILSFYIMRLIFFGLILAGWQRPFKYFFFPGGIICILALFLSILYDWSMTTLGCNRFNTVLGKDFVRRLDNEKTMRCLRVGFLILFLTLTATFLTVGIACIVLFDDQRWVNIIMVAGLFLLSQTGCIFSIFLLIFSRKIMGSIDVSFSEGNNEVKSLRGRLRTYSNRQIGFLIIYLGISLLFPVYAGISMSGGRLGMQYANIVAIVGLFLPESVFPFFYTLLVKKGYVHRSSNESSSAKYASRTIGSEGALDYRKRSEGSTFPSISIEELKVPVAPNDP